jgi:hypothetical protein
MDESCRKPDKVWKCREDHPMFKDKCCLPDTDENRLKVKKVIHCCFDKTKEERQKWADPEQIDPDTGDIRGMDLHHKAKKRGFANPMEMYLADKKDEEDKKVKDEDDKRKDEENKRKDKEDKKDKEVKDLKKQLADLTALVQQLLQSKSS